MNKRELSKVRSERSQLVVKSNELIQKSRSSMTAQEQKLILYIISKIQPTDEDFKMYTVDLKQLCKVCGIETQGKNYMNFKSSIQALASKTFWIDTKDKDYLIHWLTNVEINKYETTVSFRLDERLKPYLLQVKQNFTQFELENILAFKSRFSIRLYEFLKSYLYMHEKEFTLDELKELLLIETKYKLFKDFKKYVLNKILSEINDYTDLDITYETIKTGRKVTGILFKINKKVLFDDRLEVIKNRNKALDK